MDSLQYESFGIKNKYTREATKIGKKEKLEKNQSEYLKSLMEIAKLIDEKEN